MKLACNCKFILKNDKFDDLRMKELRYTYCSSCIITQFPNFKIPNANKKGKK